MRCCCSGFYSEAHGSEYLLTINDFKFVPLMFVALSFGVPNTLIEGHIPWFRDPKPKGTNAKGPKDNSLKLPTLKVHVAMWYMLGH